MASNYYYRLLVCMHARMPCAGSRWTTIGARYAKGGNWPGLSLSGREIRYDSHLRAVIQTRSSAWDWLRIAWQHFRVLGIAWLAGLRDTRLVAVCTYASMHVDRFMWTRDTTPDRNTTVKDHDVADGLHWAGTELLHMYVPLHILHVCGEACERACVMS